MRLRALLVDDEAPARARLARMLAAFPELELVGEAGDGVTALERIAALRPDVVFLDLEMPELDGLGVARSLAGEGPRIVFVTAYDAFALQAFEAHAVDYLVKPVAEPRLAATVRNLLRRAGPAPGLPELVRQAVGAREARFAVRAGAKLVVCDPRRISAVLARDHYAEIRMDGRELLADDPLEAFAARLGGPSFLRVHRGAIINLDFLRELEREGDRKYVAVLADPAGTRVPVSRERLDELKARLGLGAG